MQTFWRPVHHQLGAEELLELGRPVRMYRYPQTPFLAGRREAPRQAVNLLQADRNLLGQGAAASPADGDSGLVKALIIGIPVVIVVGILAFS